MKFPHISLDFDPSRRAVARFIDAVCKNPDSAWPFVCSVYSAGLNLAELRELFSTGVQYVKIGAFASTSANKAVQSVYVTRNKRKIMLHLRMVREQGKWKVFGVENG